MSVPRRSEVEADSLRAPGDVDEAWLAEMTPEEFQRWHRDCRRKYEQLERREIDLEKYLRGVRTGRVAVRSAQRRVGKSRRPYRARRTRVTRQARAPTGDGDPAPERIARPANGVLAEARCPRRGAR
jgi:hypothetical protein